MEPRSRKRARPGPRFARPALARARALVQRDRSTMMASMCSGIRSGLRRLARSRFFARRFCH
eukprot:3609616-Pyramimonas_sp.AAC.1